MTIGLKTSRSIQISTAVGNGGDQRYSEDVLEELGEGLGDMQQADIEQLRHQGPFLT